MKVIGLTGSIAMGKSEVADVFRQSGIPVFDADVEVHKLYDSPEGAALLQPLAPDAIRNNRVDRVAITQLILADKNLLNRLEAIVHGEIANRRNHFLAQAEADGHNLAVLDIPLLFEKGTESQVDVTVVVSAPEALQRQRALLRNGMTQQKLDMILKRQMPDVEKRKRATFVIENDGSLQQLRNRAQALLEKLKVDHA
jgi:dephospho-CoA kinase